MKIKITYETEAELSEALSRPLKDYIGQGAKLNKRNLHPPFKHAYLSIRKPENHCNKRDST